MECAWRNPQGPCPDSRLHLVLFHDSAEEVPLSQLAKVRVGPYYTNTREGLRLAQRILARQRNPDPPPAILTPAALTLRHAPIADCARYDNLRRTI